MPATERGITFESELGRCSGSWMGDLPVPAAGVFEVELTYDEPLVWGVDIAAITGGVALCLVSEPDGVKAIGTLLALDEDVAMIALGPTFLVVEIVGDVPVEYEGLTVEAHLHDVEVYPYEV